jgi:hypothetical protein
MAVAIIPLLFSNKITTITCNVGTSIIMSTIKATTSSITGIISYIVFEHENNMEQIQKLLKDTDMHFTITTIQAFINEQNITDSHKSISTALSGVSEILTIIHDDLQSIKNEFEYHKSRYFSSYRTFTWSQNISKLEGHNTILKHRYDLLFDLLKIYRLNKEQLAIQ